MSKQIDYIEARNIFVGFVRECTGNQNAAKAKWQAGEISKEEYMRIHKENEIRKVASQSLWRRMT